MLMMVQFDNATQRKQWDLAAADYPTLMTALNKALVPGIQRNVDAIAANATLVSQYRAMTVKYPELGQWVGSGLGAAQAGRLIKDVDPGAWMPSSARQTLQVGSTNTLKTQSVPYKPTEPLDPPTDDSGTSLTFGLDGKEWVHSGVDVVRAYFASTADPLTMALHCETYEPKSYSSNGVSWADSFPQPYVGVRPLGDSPWCAPGTGAPAFDPRFRMMPSRIQMPVLNIVQPLGSLGSDANRSVLLGGAAIHLWSRVVFGLNGTFGSGLLSAKQISDISTFTLSIKVIPSATSGSTGMFTLFQMDGRHCTLRIPDGVANYGILRQGYLEPRLLVSTLGYNAVFFPYVQEKLGNVTYVAFDFVKGQYVIRRAGNYETAKVIIPTALRVQDGALCVTESLIEKDKPLGQQDYKPFAGSAVGGVFSDTPDIVTDSALNAWKIRLTIVDTNKSG